MAKQGFTRSKVLSEKENIKLINTMDTTNKPNVTDFTCPICLDLIIEPVSLPCQHELCKMCFEAHILENKLQCPVCRYRISVWARRKKKKERSYVDEERWKYIQQMFPVECGRRMRGEESQCDGIQTALAPLRIIAENGAIKKEYEEEMQKIQFEETENEIRSAKLIQEIQERERLQEEIARQQELEDERLANELQKELSESVRTPRRPLNLRKSRRSPSSSSNKESKSTKLLNWLSPPSKRKDMESCSSDDGFTPGSTEELERRDRALAIKLQRELNRTNIK